MALLGVNIDHVATLRQQRRGKYPDPALAAAIATIAGADSITIHLREDRRHIQDRDLRVLKETVQTKLNLELGMAKDIIALALEVRPDQVTLVPEKREELTTEGGLDVAREKRKLRSVLEKFRELGIVTSLFIDPDERQIAASADLGADSVEIHTGAYADAFAEFGAESKETAGALRTLALAGSRVKKYDLKLLMGHGLDYHNIGLLHDSIEVFEYNIGFSIVSRAVFVGLDRAVREMKNLIAARHPLAIQPTIDNGN
ncbi:MAG: pyridoxine 5'-phosphate synthase [Planctomycetes bacterium]|nr:pyridoxine 5'-phosphate synthase [Planctomycetota bacterium]